MRLNKFGFVLSIFLLITSIISISSANIFTIHETSISESNSEIESTLADTAPPDLTITGPENLSIIAGWFFLSAIATDNISVDMVVYRNMASQSSYSVMTQNETDLTKYRALIDSRTYENGVNFIEIIANDTSNNINRSIVVIGVQNLEAEADVYVYNVTGLTQDCPCLNDDNTSVFWNDIEAHPVLEYGGYVKFSHNFTHFFALLVYDSSLNWISLEFDNDGDGICMEDGEDLWWFADGQEASDFTAVTFATPQEDIVQDIIFESGSGVNNDSSLNFFEIIRPFATSEPEDIVFRFGVPIAIIFASNALHQGGVRANFTIAFRSASPTGLTNTTSPFGTLPSGMNLTQDLFIYGGIGFILNLTLIFGLVIYERRKSK